MNRSASLETSTNDPVSENVNVAALKLSIAQCLMEIDQMREQMNRDQAEIDRSQKRTRVLLTELKATLSPAGRKAA